MMFYKVDKNHEERYYSYDTAKARQSDLQKQGRHATVVVSVKPQNQIEYIVKK